MSRKFWALVDNDQLYYKVQTACMFGLAVIVLVGLSSLLDWS